MLLLGCCLATPLQARPVVLELFTSQGCSSCPPADALLTELAGRGDLLPLAFHVDYWNRLGWHDEFSSSKFTLRQQSYAEHLPGGEVYTPQLVINGSRQVVGSDRRSIQAALNDAKNDPDVAMQLASGSVEVAAGQGHGTVWLVGYDPEHRTPVARGENEGRVLVESNIVRSLQAVGQWHGEAMHLPIGNVDGERVAVFLQKDNGAIVGAAIRP
jgi:hypothetical protein